LKYGIFAGKNNEAYLCTYRAARNMAFQGISATHGQIEQLYEVEGSQIIGTKIKAPFAVNSEVYVLPMENVLANKVCTTHFVHNMLHFETYVLWIRGLEL
jgi:leucyl-tRNA synthetase